MVQTTDPPLLVCFCVARCRAATGSFQYGYSISALNAAQSAMTCPPYGRPHLRWGLPTCLEGLNNASFSLITSGYTCGGLLSALCGGQLADKYGRKITAFISACLVVVVRPLAIYSNAGSSNNVD